ncbi:unnamed protein product [Strongylus vulgaris]|uniref:Uncharacterized protein n=1 Tax=Strongylus vulgaris TaxID=40348 RepID=A0A3P7IS40_STRVU|nr:unnamed protein product [Strongylus vulgaris]
MKSFNIKFCLAVRFDALTEGQGDDVLTNATAHVYKGVEGTISLGISSSRNAVGADQSSIQNHALGQIGLLILNATGNVNAQGQRANSASEITAADYGGNKSVSSIQKGEASGTGDTLVQANGGAVMSNYGFNSPHSVVLNSEHPEKMWKGGLDPY